MRKQFIYTDAKGKTTERDVFVVSEPRDSFLAIDLSEFPPAERAAYEAELERTQEACKKLWDDLLDELGLKYNWRQFKESRIVKE